MEKKKVVAFVPVKLNNQRTPGKNTKQFDDGTALITVFLKTLVNVKQFDEVYVFCSNPAIKDYLVEGVNYLQRPEFLDTQTATPQDIMSEFIKRVPADIYAVCHCTSPFVTAEHIDECISAVLTGDYDSAFTAEKIQKLFWTSKNEPLNFAADNIPRTQDLEPLYNEVHATYVFTKETVETLRRRIGKKPYITIVSGIESVDIDYPEDFIIANAIYMNLIKDNQ